MKVEQFFGIGLDEGFIAPLLELNEKLKQSYHLGDPTAPIYVKNAAHSLSTPSVNK